MIGKAFRNERALRRAFRIASLIAVCSIFVVNTGAMGRLGRHSVVSAAGPYTASCSPNDDAMEHLTLLGVPCDGGGDGDVRRFRSSDVAGTKAPMAPDVPDIRVPVILVHGIGGNPWVTWGFPTTKSSASGFRDAVVGQKPAGLTRFLLSKGYVIGKTLFAVDWGRTRGLDYVREYKRLATIIDQAKKSASSDKVDLICSDTAALICRYYLGSVEYRRRNDVRTLVMIGPSNRGLFLANALKEASVVVRQREVQSGRRSVRRADTSSASGAIPPSEEFNGMEYVLKRAEDFYESLYLEYLIENEILGSPADGGSRASSSRSFQAWLAAERSDVFRSCMLQNQSPPAGPAFKGGMSLPAQPPRDGQVLTGAYYENLAMLAGRAACLAKMGNDQSLVEKLLEYPFVSMDYKQMLAHYGSIVARYLLERLWDAAKQAGGSFALEQIEDVLRIQDPTVVDRLIEERFLYPVGTDSGGKEKVVALKGNHFLELVNSQDSSIRSGNPVSNPTKYVIAAGKTLNVLSWIWPDLGDNDAFVSLRSTFVPIALRDSFRVFAGVVYGSHHGLTYSPNVWEYVLDNLRANPVLEERRIGPEAPAIAGTLRASLWEPTYIVLDVKGVYPSGYLVVEVSSIGATGYRGRGGTAVLDGVIVPDDERMKNLKLCAWFEDEDGTIIEQGCCPVERFPEDPPGEYRGEGVTTAEANPKKAVVLRLPAAKSADKIRLGVKMVCDDISSDTFEDYLDLPFQTVRFTARVTKETPGRTQEVTQGESMSGGAKVGFAGLPAGDGEGSHSENTGTRPGTKEQTDSSEAEPSDATKPGTPGTGEGPGDSGALPLIVVKHRDKRTTTVPERVSSHERWEWDFQDGETFTVWGRDTERTVVPHEFEKPGTYEVTATSISADGRTLRKIKWMVMVRETGASEGTPDVPVEVSSGSQRGSGSGGAVQLAPGETYQFEAVTVKPPSVTVKVIGPAEWVTGRPARFDVEVDMTKPEFCISQSATRVYPGEAFSVMWERPGRYDVEAAVTVKSTYAFDDQQVTLYNTYKGRTSVNVLASGISD
ncbi:MAG TPA: hypothetical protein GX507_08915 [Clostridia bacterium]|nr:hypothetical protein [Clostridia bacterium]